MKKIKKILLLLLAFSFTTLLFNSQAYAVEYYEFEFEIIDVTNVYDVEYTPLTLYDNLRLFLLEYGELDNSVYSYEFNGWSMSYDTINELLGLSYNYEILTISNDLIMIDVVNENGFEVGIYIITTDILITFTRTFWDQIINAVADIASAFQAAATAGISLIYDGTALTSLGEIITITLGVGLVIGLFYLVIRVLPGARL